MADDAVKIPNKGARLRVGRISCVSIADGFPSPGFDTNAMSLSPAMTRVPEGRPAEVPPSVTEGGGRP